MKMELNQLLDNLRVLFFQHMGSECGEAQCDTFVDRLLEVTKDFMNMEEVAYFKYDDWNQQFLIEATTNLMNQDLMEVSDSIVADENMNNNESYYMNNHSIEELRDFQRVITFQLDHKVRGLVAFKEKESGSLPYASNEDWELFSKEFSTILRTALTISRTSHEEKRYKQLFNVTEKFHSSMSMEAVLGEIISTLQSVYPTFDYYLFLSHDNHSHGDLPIKELEYDSENVAAMQAYVTGDVQFEDLASQEQSIMYAPLKGKQGVYGVLQVISSHVLLFPKSEIKFIRLLANTAGSALENAQLYQQSKRLVTDLQLINETSHHLNSNLRLSETIEFMKHQIMKSFKADQTGFVLLTMDGEINLLNGSSEFFDTKESEYYLTFLQSRMDADQESLFIGDMSIHCSDGDLEYLSLMAVPMVESNHLKGFAVVLHRKPYYFSFDMFKLLQSLIHHSSLAMANSMLREELENMVITDHLTKLYSRSYLDEEMSKSMSVDERGTFVLIDIDNFKSVNDTYGHQVGDDILIQVAKLIKNNIRETDIGARWGGEELAIYLPQVSLEIGVQIAERIKEKVAVETEPKITISCGVSYWEVSVQDDIKDLFKRADEALYHAKKTGKNKVLVQKKM